MAGNVQQFAIEPGLSLRICAFLGSTKLSHIKAITAIM